MKPTAFYSRSKESLIAMKVSFDVTTTMLQQIVHKMIDDGGKRINKTSVRVELTSYLKSTGVLFFDYQFWDTYKSISEEAIATTKRLFPSFNEPTNS